MPPFTSALKNYQIYKSIENGLGNLYVKFPDAVDGFSYRIEKT